MSLLTEPDCTLDGARLEVSSWPKLTSEQLARVVGAQSPGGSLERAEDYDWRFVEMPVADLEFSNEDGEAPDGGWCAAHERHLRADAEAVAAGGPEYAGRDIWLREIWCNSTAIYPLFVVREDERYRLWDGYRRLAGAFRYGVDRVSVLLGSSRTS